MDSELFADLHTLSATRISICRRAVLQQAIDTLGISMHETTTYDDDSGEMFCTVQIDVPPHLYLPRLQTRMFHGDWSATSDVAIQSACFNALVYLQKVDMLIIDGVHSDELKRCQRKLLASSSWADAFEQRATELQAQLTAMIKEEKTVLPTYPTPVGNCSAPLHTHAEFTDNTKKRKLIFDLQHHQEQGVGLPSLPFLQGSSSENMSVVTNLSDGIEYVTQNHPANSLPSLPAAPYVNKPIAPRPRTALLNSKVRKPLFQNSENKGKAPEIGDNVMKDTTVKFESPVDPTPMAKKGKP